MRIGIYIFVCLVASTVYGQDRAVLFDEGSWHLDAKIGLAFYNDTFAALDNDITAGQSVQNSIKLQFMPGVSYAVKERLLAGAYLGYGFLHYNYSDLDEKGRYHNYKAGIHLRYHFLKIFPGFYLFGEAGSNFNYLKAKNTDGNDYFKSYIDTGFSYKLTDEWVLSFVLKDVLFYYSSSYNFENRDFGFGNSKIFKEMTAFPFFSVTYRLN